MEPTHADLYIADPDASNPTRPRLERPLDTIRSFEAAIDGNTSRRQHFRSGKRLSLITDESKILTIHGIESASPLSTQNRRTSYYNGKCLPTPSSL